MISCRCLFLPKTKNFYFINDHLTIWSSPTNDHAAQRPIKWKCAGRGRRLSSRERARLILFKSVLLFHVTYCSENRISKFIFSLSILPSISFPILVRNHILLFGWILTSSILQKGEVFDKDSSVLLSNILTSVNKGTLVMVFSDTQSLFWNWTSEILFVAEIIFCF